MKNLDTEIRRLAGELRAVEQMLVEACGLTPVIGHGATACVMAGTGWMRSWSQRAYQRLARLRASEAMLAVHTPQPD